jgi:hypothetical protein
MVSGGLGFLMPLQICAYIPQHIAMRNTRFLYLQGFLNGGDNVRLVLMLDGMYQIRPAR